MDRQSDQLKRLLIEDPAILECFNGSPNRIIVRSVSANADSFIQFNCGRLKGNSPSIVSPAVKKNNSMRSRKGRDKRSLSTNAIRVTDLQ